MGVLASKGGRRVWALLSDGTYRTNRTYIIVSRCERRAETRLLIPGFWLLAPSSIFLPPFSLLLSGFSRIHPRARRSVF